jgi:hypothetical protein
MSDQLEITYRGYAVHYAENQDVWRCNALDLDAERLPTVKAKIDRVIAAARKLAEPLSMIRVDYHGTVKPVTVMSLAQPRAGREVEEAWAMVPGDEWYFDHAEKKRLRREVLERQKIALNQIYDDSPSNREKVAEAERLKAQIETLEDQKRALLASMSRDALAGLGIGNAAEDDAA